MLTPFENLRERLLHAGISAPRHVRRYVTELADHFEDLVRAGQVQGNGLEASKAAARQRLGSDEALAAPMLSRPELRSVVSRYPWLAFGVLPPVALGAAVLALVLIEGGLMTFYKAVFGLGITPSWLQSAVHGWNFLAVYALPLALAGLLAVMGIRQRMKMSWIFLGVAIVCVLGSFHDVRMFFSDIPGKSQLSVGLGYAYPFPKSLTGPGLIRTAINLTLVFSAFALWRRWSDNALRAA